jgi:hypothetical protein
MRVLAILRSTVLRESTRVDLALTRAFFLVVTFVVLLSVAWSQRSVTVIGPAVHSTMLVLSLLLMVFLAVRLGGDSVGDFRSGMLAMLFLTGLTQRQWLIVRVVQLWAGFASVWLIRAPLLIFVFTLRGVSVEKIVVTETLLLTGFLVLSSLGLLGSFKAKSRQQAWISALISIIAWEILLHAPMVAVAVLTRYYGWSVSQRTTELTEKIGDVALTSRYAVAMIRPLEMSQCLTTFAVYGVLSAVVLGRFCRLLSSTNYLAEPKTVAWMLGRFCRLLLIVPRGAIGKLPEQAKDRSAGRSENQRVRRASRRCWDDALAWQACCFHGNGSRLVMLKCAAYSLLGPGLLLSIPFGYLLPVFIGAAAICGVAMLAAVNKPSDCLSREIREQTLPTLLLTPNSTDDVYAGWQRGAWHLAWPDIMFAAEIALVSYALDPVAPAIVVSLAVAILFSGPFMMLSPLVPFTFSGIATGLALTFVALVIVAICIGCGATVHPLAAPVILLPLVWLYNRVLRRNILPQWMERKISSIV